MPGLTPCQPSSVTPPWIPAAGLVHVQVDDVDGDDVTCTANTHANLDGLVTVFHTERSPDQLNNVQNDLPIMTQQDKEGIKDLGREFEVDFISLSFTRSGECIQVAREFLDSIGMQSTKVRQTTPPVQPEAGCIQEPM